jgi:uncharacterized protein (TIGR02217 family)
MSSLVYPTNIRGLQFPIVRTPVFKTNIQESPSGKESALSYQVYPRIRFQLSYELARDDVATSELRALFGLFEAMQGRYDTFLFTDPDFSSVTAENFGTGTGSQTQFQLTAKFQNTGGPGWPSLIQNLNGAPSIFVNGVLKTGGGVDYTLGTTGIVTFTSAPAAAAALTWTGSFYYRCRFTQDTMDFVKFMYKWWELDQVEFISKKL